MTIEKMTIERMKQILDTEILYDEVVKDKGLHFGYEQHYPDLKATLTLELAFELDSDEEKYVYTFGIGHYRDGDKESAYDFYGELECEKAISDFVNMWNETLEFYRVNYSLFERERA